MKIEDIEPGKWYWCHANGGVTRAVALANGVEESRVVMRSEQRELKAIPTESIIAPAAPPRTWWQWVTGRGEQRP